MLLDEDFNVILDIADELGITIDYNDSLLECEYICSNGMNGLFSVDTTFCETLGDVAMEVYETYQVYDVDEECILHLEVPGHPSIREILDDCEELQDIIYEFSQKLLAKARG